MISDLLNIMIIWQILKLTDGHGSLLEMLSHLKTFHFKIILIKSNFEASAQDKSNLDRISVND